MYRQIPLRILHIIPREINLSLGLNLLCKLCPRSCLDMTRFVRVVAAEIGTRTPILVEYIAWEVPIQLCPFARDTASGGLSDQPQTVLIGILEQETRIVPCKTFETLGKQRVGLAIERRSGGGVVKFRKIVVESVDGDGSFADKGVADCTTVESEGWSPTDSFSKTKGEEADAGHEQEDD
jgi:hypothetical protein